MNVTEGREFHCFGAALEKALAKGFSFNMESTKSPCVCRRYSLVWRQSWLTAVSPCVCRRYSLVWRQSWLTAVSPCVCRRYSLIWRQSWLTAVSPCVCRRYSLVWRQSWLTAVSRCWLLVGDGKNEIFPFLLVFHLFLYVLVYVEFSLSIIIHFCVA